MLPAGGSPGTAASRAQLLLHASQSTHGCQKPAAGSRKSCSQGWGALGGTPKCPEEPPNPTQQLRNPAEGWGREGRRCWGGIFLRPKGSQHAHPTKMLPGCHGAVNVLLPSPGKPGKRQKKLGKGRKRVWEELPASHGRHRGGLLSVLRNTEPPDSSWPQSVGFFPRQNHRDFSQIPKLSLGVRKIQRALHCQSNTGRKGTKQH